MSNDIKADRGSGVVNISGSTVDNSTVVGHDQNTVTSASLTLAEYMAKWRQEMQRDIDGIPEMSPAEKQEAKDQVVKVEHEAAKGAQADKLYLQKLINVLGVMAPDIFEVAVATLANPLAGAGLAVKKIGDRAKIESSSAGK